MADATPLPQAAEPEVRAFPASISEAVKRLESLPIAAHTAFIVDGTLDSDKTARISMAFRVENGWSFGGYLERRVTGKFAVGGTIIKTWT